MDRDIDEQMGPRTRERLVGRLDHMVESGRLTEAEAEKLRGATAPNEFEDGVLNIRVRHARAKLNAAVEGGHMSEEEAAAYLDRLKRGEHPRGLRAHLRKLIPGR